MFATSVNDSEYVSNAQRRSTNASQQIPAAQSGRPPFPYTHDSYRSAPSQALSWALRWR